MTNLTSTQIAKMTATVTGDGYKRAADKGAAIKRFVNACTEKGIADASAILAADCPEEALAAAMNPAPKSVLITDAAFADSSVAKANEASWQAIPAVRKASRRAALRLVETCAPEKKRAAAKEPCKRAAVLEAAQRGELPQAPDFSAETHKRFRAKLTQIVAAAEAGDIEALRAFQINPVSSSPKAMAKYRDLAVIALEARAKAGAAA